MIASPGASAFAAVRAKCWCARSRKGTGLHPAQEDGEPVENPEQFEAMSEERKKMLTQGREDVQRLARDFIKSQQEIARKVREEVESAVRRFASELVEPLIAAIVAGHPQEEVRRYLGKVQEHILANLDDFQEEERPPALPFPFPIPSRDRLVPYEVNVRVDNAGAAGAPVVVEDVPTYQNLVGAIERMVDQTGKLVTTHRSSRQLLRLYGGTVLNIDDALTEPLVWKPRVPSVRLEIESWRSLRFRNKPEPTIDIRLLARRSTACQPTTPSSRFGADLSETSEAAERTRARVARKARKSCALQPRRRPRLRQGVAAPGP
jgi:hypothetical protein